MTRQIDTHRDHILLTGLPDVVFDGWAVSTFETALKNAGEDPALVRAVFPGGVADIVAHFSDWADASMIDTLADIAPEDMRVRDRIRAALLARFNGLAPWKEQVRMASTWWAVPGRQTMAAKCVWRTADCIWDWAGDIATDYNRYTKRALLCGVLTSSTVAWLNHSGDDDAALEEFIDRRIDRIMTLGKMMGRIMPGKKDNNKRSGKGHSA